MRKVTELIYKGKEFTIVEDDGWYISIPNEFIENGRLTKAWNGLQGKASTALDACIRRTMQGRDWEYIIENGGTEVDAWMAVHNMTREQAEMIVAMM